MIRAKRTVHDQLIVDKIHAPALPQAGWHRHGPAMQRHVFATPDVPAQLEAFQPLQTTDALLVDGPALASQQDQNALLAKAWARMRDVANAEPQRRLIAPPRLVCTSHCD